MSARLTRALLLLACVALLVPLSGPSSMRAQEEQLIQCFCASDEATMTLRYPASGGAVSGTFASLAVMEEPSALFDEDGSSHEYLEARTVMVSVELAGTYAPDSLPPFSLQLSGTGSVDIDNTEDDRFDRSYEVTLHGTATGDFSEDGSLTLSGLTAEFTPQQIEAGEIPNTEWMEPPAVSMPTELNLACQSMGSAAAPPVPKGAPIARPPQPPQPPAAPPQPPAPSPAPPPTDECGPVQVIYLDDLGVPLNEADIDAFIENTLAQGGPDLSLIISHRQSLVDRYTEQGFDQVDGLLHDLGNIAETCPFVLIVGDPDVIPFAMLPNPTSDGDVLYTDDVYGDNDHDVLGMPDIPVARIPDGWSLDLLVTQLSPSDVPGGGDFTLANSKRPHAGGVASQVFGENRVLLWSLPTRHGELDSSQVDVRQSYFMLHGGAWDTSVWWGEEDVYPEAFTVQEARSEGIVLSGACYGSYTFGRTPRSSITLSFLESGARAFVGSTGITYSPLWTSGPNPTGPLRHDALFHQAFLSAVSGGQAPLAAFMEAKGKMADLCRTADSTGDELKMLHEFIYFGKP